MKTKLTEQEEMPHLLNKMVSKILEKTKMKYLFLSNVIRPDKLQTKTLRRVMPSFHSNNYIRLMLKAK